MKAEANKMTVSLVIGVLVMCACNQARAIPILQLYIPGSYYDTEEATWILGNPSPGVPMTFKLWAIGDVDEDRHILDVKLAVAYSTSAANSITITIAPSKTEDLVTFTDPSVSGPLSLLRTVAGGVPTLGDTSALPSHGIYGVDTTTWQEYALGDFELTDSPLADFGGSVPTVAVEGKMGQINAYEVTVSNLAIGEWVHFDLYNHVASNSGFKYINAPFSHDAEANEDGGVTPGPGAVPEPASLAIWGLGLMAVGLYRRRRS